jgi:proteic killer suppression protein
MEIEFDQEYLEELYYYGRTSNKKYRFQPEIIRNYVEIVYTLKIVTRVEDLYLLKGLHCEKNLATWQVLKQFGLINNSG